MRNKSDLERLNFDISKIVNELTALNRYIGGVLEEMDYFKKHKVCPSCSKQFSVAESINKD